MLFHSKEKQVEVLNRCAVTGSVSHKNGVSLVFHENWCSEFSQHTSIILSFLYNTYLLTLAI